MSAGSLARNIGIALTALLYLSVIDRSAAQAPVAPAPPPVYNPTSPQPNIAAEPPSVEVAPDHRVTFRIHAPDASSVTLNGDFLLGAPAVKLTKGADGTWTYTSDPLTPDSYTYNFTVDGVMVLDTRNDNFKNTPNALFNFFDMPDPTTDFMALRDVPHGRVEAVIYHSATLNMERRIHVYLPPNFEKLPGKLPVLYLLHGGGDNDISWTSAGKINLILDNLYAAGRVKDMIVVMPSGHVPGAPRRMMQPLPPEGDPFTNDFLNDLVPFVQKTYPVSNRREDTAIAGFSMGGVQTLNLALFHPEMFDYVFPMSTGYFPDGIKQIQQENPAALKNVVAHPFRQFIMGRGKGDKLTAANSAATLQMLDEAHIPHKYIELDGVHSFVFARRFLLEVFPLMFQEPARSAK
jgi:enterochelin esterase-like enzyme